MSIELLIADSDEDIYACFPAFKELRPQLDYENFLAQIRRQQTQCYEILALRHDGRIKSVAGFRSVEFLAWGKVLYIDDLSTLQNARGNGYAGKVLDHLIAHAKSSGCAGVHLDTGYARHAAHRLYLEKGFQFNCHHLAFAC
ncbi:GNAT family N-acetyltransferase [Undibacterium sp. Ren11W]|uniref:GNAT family N-acetyltransferase n=1 Tax=Undibacterium sp. Ren11W TaxID=3413045 RepID=UPI003BF0BE7D